MKERNVFMALIVLLIITLASVLYFQFGKVNKTELTTTTTKDTTVTDFTYLPNLDETTFKEKLDSGEAFSVLIWRPDCGDSQKFIQEFQNYFVELDSNGNFERLKYDLGNPDKNFYSFDISTLGFSIGDRTSREQYKDLYGFYYTPSLVHYENGQVVNIAEWDPIYGFIPTDYLQWFYDNNLITPQTAVYHEGSSDEVSQ